MGALAAKRERAERANALLRTIAGCGRRFFANGDRVSAFEVDDRGRVWLRDKRTGALIYTHYAYRWRHFTEGGTLKSLCERLRDFIRTGEPQRLNLGPWPQWICDGDLWGYGDDMRQVRQAAADLGIAPCPDADPCGQRTPGSVLLEALRP